VSWKGNNSRAELKTMAPEKKDRNFSSFEEKKKQYQQSRKKEKLGVN
jgi:hypothetical protein